MLIFTKYWFLFAVICLTAAQNHHPGAYSSPQYAKKMYQIKQSFHPAPNQAQEDFQSSAPYAIMRRNSFGSAEPQNSNEVGLVPLVGRENGTQARSGFLNTASNFLSGRGGQMVAEIARELISRSTGSSQVGFECISQVLSLNLTNLVILVVLKALILAAGFFGAGGWKGGSGYGRSFDSNNDATSSDYLSQSEILLYLGYLLGEQADDYDCLNLLACQQPAQSKMYADAADLLLHGAKMFQGAVPYSKRHERIAAEVKQAAEWGSSGATCEQRYQCARH